MRTLALVIGNNNYAKKEHVLTNAVNDAQDINTKLQALEYYTLNSFDCTTENFDGAIKNFATHLSNYDVGLFYFSGHGLQIEGKNFLTGIDTSFIDESSAKYSSIPLDQIIEYMHKSGAKTKILILDACRDNPLPNTFRGPAQSGLAPIHAPKGTFIAFSTSPGEKARDYGAGRNSVYTGALLNHIDDINIPIEDMFKRVRTTVSNMTEGKQTSWEHTSMIGNYAFNSGQLLVSLGLPYRNDVVRDSEFVNSGSQIDDIIEKLKRSNWYTQKSGFFDLFSVDKSKLTESDYFLIGRCVLSAAEGGEYTANEFLNDLAKEIIHMFGTNHVHVLNGILYEMYFNSKGKFRLNSFKSQFVDQIFNLQQNQQFSESFKFISKQLEKLHSYLYYIPTETPQSVPLELKMERFTDKQKHLKAPFFELKSVKYQTIELLMNSEGYHHLDIVEFEEMKEKFSKALCIPMKYLTISSNHNESVLNKIGIPWNLKLHPNRE
ncbi:MAG: hypothetical protein RLZZ546_3313 [Bacteroidota bacterium]|jgi:hypothetical protein